MRTFWLLNCVGYYFDNTIEKDSNINLFDGSIFPRITVQPRFNSILCKLLHLNFLNILAINRNKNSCLSLQHDYNPSSRLKKLIDAAAQKIPFSNTYKKEKSLNTFTNLEFRFL